MAKLWLLARPDRRTLCRVTDVPPADSEGWEIVWESGEVSRAQVQGLRSFITERWRWAEIAPGAYAVAPTTIAEGLAAVPETIAAQAGLPTWFPRDELVDPGVLYVLTNAAFSGLVKVGRTTGDPKARAQDLSTTSVPHPFEVAWSSGVLERHSDAERELHEALTKFRESTNREFFRVELPEVRPYCEAVARAYAPKLTAEAVSRAFASWLRERLAYHELPDSASRAIAEQLLSAEGLSREEASHLRYFLESMGGW